MGSPPKKGGKKKTLVLTLGSPPEKGGKKKTLVLTLGRPPDLDFRTWTYDSGTNCNGGGSIDDGSIDNGSCCCGKGKKKEKKQGLVRVSVEVPKPRSGPR